MTTVCVSVIMITYNHEKYIEEAIKGVLMQDCNFEIELIIANDSSPDDTDTIIKSIINQHPRGSWIKYIKHKQNLGMMPNFIFAMQQCKGKYIALCEGDDFWTDSLKLQKQVNFLETNTEYILSFHNVEIKNQRNNTNNLFVKKYDFLECKIEDIFDTWLIPTGSMVFKNRFVKNFPTFLEQATHGDLALQIYLSKFGKFSVIDEVMGVYRINETSVSINFFSGLEHNNNHIKQLKLMNVFSERKYEYQIQKRIFLFYLINADLFKNKNFLKPIYWVFKGFLLRPSLVFFYKKEIITVVKNTVFRVMFLE